MHKLTYPPTTKRLFVSFPLLHLAFGLLCVLAIAIRVALYGVITDDYTIFVSPWYDFIQSHSGFAALQYNFSNYNPPYLYLLAIATYLPIPKLIAIKSISVVFDVVLALFSYRILRLKYHQPTIPWLGAIVLLFAPTILINSAAWGQCDAIYATFCVGSLYFLLTRRWGWACIFFGVAIAFKLQAIFFAPILLLVTLKRELPLRYLLLIPAVFLLLLAPAYLAGRDPQSLLTIYPQQASTGGVGGGTRQLGNDQAAPQATNMPGQFDSADGQALPPNGRDGRQGNGFGGSQTFAALTYNAPTIYQLLAGTAFARNTWVGIGLASMVVALLGGLLLLRKPALTAEVMLHMTLLCVLAIPFFLPNMHERYFYLADVISIIYAFYFPRWFFFPIVMQLASLLSYAPYLLNTEIMQLSYVAVAVLGLILIVGATFIQRTGSGRATAAA